MHASGRMTSPFTLTSACPGFVTVTESGQSVGKVMGGNIARSPYISLLVARKCRSLLRA